MASGFEEEQRKSRVHSDKQSAMRTRWISATCFCFKGNVVAVVTDFPPVFVQYLPHLISKDLYVVLGCPRQGGLGELNNSLFTDLHVVEKIKS